MQTSRRAFLRNTALAAASVPILGACSSRPESTPTAAASPPASTSPRQARKGVGLGHEKTQGLARLDSLNVDWFYTWGTAYPAARPKEDFVPMIWGQESIRQGGVEESRSEVPLTNALNLLGFNEPDNPKQSNLTVPEAVSLWPELQQSGLRLGSPAPVQALGDWLKEFMDQCATKNLQVDFVTVHAYVPPESDNFLKHIQQVHELYGKPVWITEYAAADWKATAQNPSRYSGTQIRTFMQETAQGLRDMPFVERFAWKTRAEGDPIMGESALFHDDGSLTDTGELYSSL